MTPSVLELGVVAACTAPAAYYFSRIEDSVVRKELGYTAAASVLCFLVTRFLIPRLSFYLHRRGLKGRDMGRRGTPQENLEIPSALGIVCGAVYLMFVIITQLVRAKTDLEKLADYNAALLSIAFMTLLGFADDVLDLPWRYKLLLPSVASLPLLATYRGGTSVLIPSWVASFLALPDKSGLTSLGGLLDSTLGLVTIDTAAAGTIVELGGWYFVYMGLLAVFATNAINIYAGINGLEAGQSLVIGLGVLTANLHELASGAAGAHLFSAQLGIPFLAVTAAILTFNTHPAAVFVGDTFCYFAGMTFAVQAILGHFSKSLLLFLIPQVFNFVYSLPQLFKVYECPRHRLPDYDPATNTVRPSRFVLRIEDAPAASKPEAPPAPAAAAEGGKAAADGAAAATKADGKAGGVKVYRDNMTLINLVLRLTGPMHERTTTNVLLLLQVACCALGLYLRYEFGMALAAKAAAAASGAAATDAAAPSLADVHIS